MEADVLRVLDEIGGQIASLQIHRIGAQRYVLTDEFCSAFNAKQRYIPITRRLQILIGEHRIDLRIGERSILVDGRMRDEPLTAPVQLISGKPALPIDFVTVILPSLLEVEGEFDPDKLTLKLYSSLSPLPSTPSKGKLTVVIDPGHGGSDPGVVIGDLAEKEINLRIAEAIAEELRGRGVNVRLTRETDIPLSLERRVRFANELRSDLYISIHLDSSAVQGKRGYRIFVNRLWRRREESLETAARSPVSPGNIQLAYKLALRIAQGLDKLGLPGRVYRLPIHGLSGLTMPALILELGFLSNDADRALLGDDDFLSSIIESLSESIVGMGKDERERWENQ